MNVLLLLPDGVGIRNFLLTPFARELSRSAKVWAMHVIPDRLLDLYRESAGPRLEWEHFVPYRETALTSALRYSLSYAHMNWADTKAMRFSLRAGGRGSWRTRTVHRLGRGVGRVAAAPSGIRLLARLHADAVRRLPIVNHYVRLLKQIRPDVVFCSHQRPPVAIPVVVAARVLQIPTATFIFSWDNLCGKGRIAAPFDHYLVWSPLMRDELRRFYPDVAADRIHVVGTPQFDFYADSSLAWSRAELFARIAADPDRPLICYSGGDVGNSPEDAAHVGILMEHIRRGRIRSSAQVVLRPAPVDDGTRFEGVCREFPELRYAQPAWVSSGTKNWDQFLPTMADAQFLTNLTAHADLNVNLGSTMTLDFAIRDKPVVNVAFDVASPPPFGAPLWDHHYQFEHYAPVISLQAARFARSAGELASHVEAYLTNPSLDAQGRRRLVELQLGTPPGRSSQTVIEALRTIANRAEPGRVSALFAERRQARAV